MATNDQGMNALARPRTRDLIHNVIHAGEVQRLAIGTASQRQPRHPQTEAAAQEPALAPSATLLNKTWNIHKTTPFYNFSHRQYAIYETELLTYIAANARNLSSSTLSQQTQNGTSTFVSEDRSFPSQIDSSGRNLIENLDDPGDIVRIEFQQLSLDDVVPVNDEEEDLQDDRQGSLMISITVRPKGKTREQTCYCAVLLDQAGGNGELLSPDFTHFNLVLLKAPVVIGQLVTRWLERKFDCRICRLVLQSFELRGIVDSSLEIMYNRAQGQGDKRPRPIELHYSFPEAVEGLKSISLSIPPDETRQLLVSREEWSDAGFLDGIEAHCSESMRIDFDRLSLTRAGCASWYLASEGKVKMFPAISGRHSISNFIRAIGMYGT